MKDLTTGKPLKVILLFALPIMLSAILQSLYNMGDSMIVSNLLGQNSLAAVGASGVIINTLISFANGGTQGFAIPVSRFFGARDEKNLRKAMAGSVLLSSALAVILTVFSLLILHPLLILLNTPDTLMPLCLTYARINIAGLTFVVLYNFCTNMLRAVGNSRTPLIFLTISVVMNIFLDLLFVGPFSMGIAGAAWATILSQAVAGVLSLVFLLKRYRNILPEKKDFHAIESGLMKELASTGLAMSFMGCIVNIGTIILQSGINSLNETIIAAHTAARRVFDILTVFMYTIGLAMTTYTGQNLGAGKKDRIREGVRVTVLFTLAEAVVLAGLCFLTARPLIHLITGSDSATLLNAAVMYLKVSVVNFVWLGPLFILRCTMQGLGHKLIPLFTSGVEMVTKIVSVLVLTPALGYLGIAITEPISWFLSLILIGSFYLTHRP